MFYKTRMDALVIMVMTRNECRGLPEWLAHHRAQGVSHFFLIDNDSTPGLCNMSALGSDATVWRWAQRATLNHSNQQAAYQHFLPRVRRLSPVNRTWIGIWDVDEFAFGVKQTLLEHLRILPPRVEQVCMLWTVFGSSGHHQQPACVTASNVYRAETSDTIGKCVQRLDRTDSPQVHRSILVNESWYQKRRGACLCPDLQRYCSHDGRFPSMACPMARAPQAFGRWKLRLHHYVSQSHEMMAMVRRADRGRNSNPIMS